MAPLAPPAEPTPTGDVFVLEVTGTGSATAVTWGTPGGSNQQTNVKLPWRKEIPDDGFGVVSLVVATGTGGSEITCRVTRPDGQVRQNSSSGSMAMVTCSSGP